ncbi:MAG: bifunctional chorismate mutase/prephenate dehydratase, partial [Parasporobacterium sp.]|nr:bifunctional chorismate mutase/prephenate dehydratase [Parasporobacterium sp.]
FPEAALVSFPGFPEAYRAVETGDCEHAVLPIENSYVGEVGQVTDMMFQGSLYINAVHTLRIRQNLLAVPGAHMSDIERVISHPQALAQCRDYIASHGFTAVEAGNTAVAAEQVARGADIHTAAIASQETAETYGLAVLDHDIQTSHENATRFAVFSRVQNKSPQEKEASRFMLMFTVRNEAGSLAKAIDIIGEYGFNMSSLRSRPLGSLAWQYYFFIEAHGDIFSAKGREMLGRLQNTCGMLKVVGNYPEPEEL